MVSTPIPRYQHDEARASPLESYYRQPELWEMGRFEASEHQRLRARVIAALLDPEVASVLDVGCGNGFVTRELRARGLVVGLDPSAEALARFEGNSVLGTSDALPFGDRSFDAVVCTEVLEHLNQAVFEETVRELPRVAARYLVIGVPYRQDLRQGMTQCGECGWRYHVDLHQRSFNKPDEVLRLFPGFSIEGAVLLGVRHDIGSRLFSILRNALAGPPAHSEFARCPKCGSSKNLRYREMKGRRLRRWFFAGVEWRMPKRHVPNWMVLLLWRRM